MHPDCARSGSPRPSCWGSSCRRAARGSGCRSRCSAVSGSLRAIRPVVGPSAPPGGASSVAGCFHRHRELRLGRMPTVAPTSTHGTIDNPAGVGGPPAAYLVRGRHLFVLLDLRSADPGEDDLWPASDLAALVPLLDCSGIVVEAIQWLRSTGFDRDPPGAGEDVRPPAAGSPSRPRDLLVLRLDMVANEQAIQARGDGDLGIRRVVAVTVARAASLLTPVGRRPRLLNGDTALRSLTQWCGGPLTAAEHRGHPATAPYREGRRSVQRSGRHHRVLRCVDRPGGCDAILVRPEAAGRPQPRPAPRPLQGVVVSSTWVRAGPTGTRSGRSVRIEAPGESALDELERVVRRASAPKAVLSGWPSTSSGPRCWRRCRWADRSGRKNDGGGERWLRRRVRRRSGRPRSEPRRHRPGVWRAAPRGSSRRADEALRCRDSRPASASGRGPAPC